jgi:hypothetical protein
MSRRPAILRRALLVPLVLAAVASPPADAGGAERFPNVRHVGATVMLHEDDVVRVILGFKHASLHPEARFLLLDLAVTATGGKEVRIHRESITLRTPKGAALPMTAQQRINERWAEVGPMFQAARVADDPLDRYMKSRFERSPIGFFLTRPGSGIVRDRFAVNNRFYVDGPILFESPDGRWDPGIYLLRIANDQIAVDIPFAIRTPVPAKGLDSAPADP